MNPSRLLRLAVATLGVAVSSCHDTTAPPEAALNGFYSVTSVNGALPPVDISVDASGRLVLLEETIQFDGRGGAVLQMATRDSLSDAPAEIVTSTLQLRYRVSGTEVQFTVLCGPGASCVNFPSATIVDPSQIAIQNGTLTYLLRKIAEDPV